MMFFQENKTLKVTAQLHKHGKVKLLIGMVSEHSAKWTLRLHNFINFQQILTIQMSKPINKSMFSLSNEILFID